MLTTPKVIVIVHLEPEMAQRIEYFQQLNHLHSRSAAIRVLIEKALNSEESK